MTASELLKNYGSGERAFVEADLRWADLRWADLRGANLYGANLYGANLRGADLREAYLYGANLRGANLRGAYLSGANLYGANLCGADLYGANLREAKFDDKTIVSCGSVGPAASSGRYATWFVFEDGSIHCFTGCFSDSIEELDRQSAKKHSGANREWYQSAIGHIRLSARIALEEHTAVASDSKH